MLVLECSCGSGEGLCVSLEEMTCEFNVNWQEGCDVKWRTTMRSPLFLLDISATFRTTLNEVPFIPGRRCCKGNDTERIK
jgi:hypothetical protein